MQKDVAQSAWGNGETLPTCVPRHLRDDGLTEYGRLPCATMVSSVPYARRDGAYLHSSTWITWITL